MSFTHADPIYEYLTQTLNIPRERIKRSHIDFMCRARERFVYNTDASMRSKNLFGDVAEGGVYKGDFSKVINDAFPESRLYLFDTFGGFDERDYRTDEHFNDSLRDGENRYKCFANTSVGTVLEKLPYPEKAIFKSGYFPESAEGVDGNFIFVNLDFDLYAPIKAGLEFFYPKMVKGGVILIHDYYCSSFDAKKAVDEFCADKGLYPLPIGDIHSVAIVKN